jgi:hypothetical protein
MNLIINELNQKFHVKVVTIFRIFVTASTLKQSQK